MSEEEDKWRIGHIEESVKQIKDDIRDHGELINDINITTAIQKTELTVMKDTFVTVKNWIIIFVVSQFFIYVIGRVSEYMGWMQ